MPVPLPVVLGHEGAGIVEAVGNEVTEVAVGDHVVLTFGYCGKCSSCRQGLPSYCEHQMEYNFAGRRTDGDHRVHQAGGAELHDSFFTQSSFATYAIAHENNTVRVPRDVPLELLGPLGCGIQTGAGAVLNSLNVPAGASIAIFGTGAVGLAAIMAARVAAATTIIAVDINDERLALAKELGATHRINSRQGNLVEQVQQITGGGADFCFDTTGRPEVIRAAVQALRTHGVCGLVGVTAPDRELSFEPNDIMVMGRTVKGILQGDSVPSIFIPRLIELYKQGQFPFDRLVKFYEFDQINQAAEDSERGVTIKPVLRIGSVAA